MLVYKKGDILKAEENVICHQVNVQGVMGGGLAKQVASTYPNVYEKYKNYCSLLSNNYELLGHDYIPVKAKENQFIANCFTQKPNFDTDYDAIINCFSALMNVCKKSNRTIAVPYKYGCGIAHGDWNIVSQIFERLSNEIGVDIVIYQFQNE